MRPQLVGANRRVRRDPDSSRAWLYGKLLLSLLGQKLGRQGQDISPWGYPLERETGQPLA